jgi:hypothetical protein
MNAYIFTRHMQSNSTARLVRSPIDDLNPQPQPPLRSVWRVEKKKLCQPIAASLQPAVDPVFFR